QRTRELTLEPPDPPDPRRRSEGPHLDVRRWPVATAGLCKNDHLVHPLGERPDLRDRRSQDRMLRIDALREEDQPLHQKKSVSPSVKRQARGSVSSSPASALPMKWSVVRVGKKPREAYAARCPGAGIARSAREPGCTSARHARSNGFGGPTRSAT